MFTFLSVRTVRAFTFFLAVLVLYSCNDKQPEQLTLEMLAFSSGEHVYISQWPDGHPQRIAEGSDASLSYNGNHLAYSSRIGEKRRVRITDLRNNNQWFIEDIHGAGFRPQWSPNQELLLFSSLVLTRNIPHRIIVVYNPFTKHKSAITLDQTDLYSPVWSPDGQSILAHDKQNLYEWDLKGKLKHTFPLKDIFGHYHYSENSSFRPSSDRDLWLFEAGNNPENGNQQPMALFLFDSSINESTRITSDAIAANSFCWGPSGETILVAATISRSMGDLPAGDHLIEFSLDGEPVKNHQQNTVSACLYTIVVPHR